MSLSSRFCLDGAYISDNSSLNVSSSGRIHKPKDIHLPHQKDPVSHIGIDIGGTLAKVAYFSRDDGGALKFFKIETEKLDEFLSYLRRLVVKIELENGVISNEKSFDHHLSHFRNHSVNLYGTGGGSIKFQKKLATDLQLEPKTKETKGPFIQARDEMESLITGLNFLINNIPNEVFIYDDSLDLRIEDERKLRYINFDNSKESVYPYLLVNIGSGVSMIKVTGPKEHVRIGGSSIGGGTLWGILSLLTNAKTYDDMLAMASAGDNANVDMLVGDIYGESYNKIGLKSTTIASSFGKVFKTVTGQTSGGYDRNDESMYGSENESLSTNLRDGYLKDSNESVSLLTSEESGEHPIGLAEAEHMYPSLSQFQRLSKFRQLDISKSFLYAVSNNIGQIAYLQAEKYDLERIFFAGSFIRNHLQTIITLTYAINFWSKGAKRAYFLRHEGYLGALGAFIKEYE